MRCAPALVLVYRSVAEMNENYAMIRNHFFATLPGLPGQKQESQLSTAASAPDAADHAAARASLRSCEPLPPAEPPPVGAIEPPPLPVLIEDIVRAVCIEFHMTKTELLSERRTKEVVVPRHLAFSLCKYLTTRSLPEIGRRFGDRDHTTVLHGVRKMAPVLDATKDGMPDDATPAHWVRIMREHMGI